MDQMQTYMMMLEKHHLTKYDRASDLSIYSMNPRVIENQMDPARVGKLKICKCCGDIAKSNHFGALCCCSCKAFFRRSVQNESYKNFHCPYNSNCEITVLSRKCCQFCRFEKCVRIGMEKSWVMSEEERLQLLKSRMLKKQKKAQEVNEQTKASSSSKDSLADDSSQNSEYCYSKESNEIYYPDYNLINTYLTNGEINRIEKEVNDYLASCVQIQPKFLCSPTLPLDDKPRLADSDDQIIQLFLNCVYQFANFAKKLTFFKTISLLDQQVLLRNSIIELCFLRSAFCFEGDMFYRTVLVSSHSNGHSNGHPNSIHSTNCPNKENVTQSVAYQFGKVPVLRMESLKQFLDDHLSNKFLTFIKQVQECNLDEIMVVLMVLVVLFNPERTQLIDYQNVTAEQEFYLDILKRYMDYKFGPSLSGTLFAKLLMTLPNVRELAELFAEFQLENRVLDRFSFDETNKFGEDCFDRLESDPTSNHLPTITIRGLSD